MGDRIGKALASREGFLAWEAEQEARWEFIEGAIKMMAGGTVAHSVIVDNVHAVLRPAARRRGCIAFQHNQKLAPAHDSSVFYPDILVTCEQLDDGAQLVASANVIVEVSSKSTHQEDFSWKWEIYKNIPELRHYLIFESDKARVTHYSRGSTEQDWQIEIVAGRARSVIIGALDIDLPLATAYEGTSLADG